MAFRFGVLNPANVDPLLILMAAEAETVEDEMDVGALIDQYMEIQLNAQNPSNQSE